MRYGILSGALWGLDTVILGLALLLAPLAGASEASIASALLHDLACTLLLLLYMGLRGRLRDTWAAVHTRAGRAVMGAALLGGPVGMSGYLIAINNIGPSYTAIISTLYPAVGAGLAALFLGERMRGRQVVALCMALVAVMVVGWSSSGSEATGSALLGILGALACVIGWGSEAVILAWGMRDEAVDNEVALQLRQTTSALLYLLLVAPIAGAIGLGITAGMSPVSGVVLLAGLAGTVSYLFYYKAIDLIGASRGMALNISYSAWAVGFALLLQGAIPTPIQVLCCVIILICTVLAATPEWGALLRRERATT